MPLRPVVSRSFLKYRFYTRQCPVTRVYNYIKQRRELQEIIRHTPAVSPNGLCNTSSAFFPRSNPIPSFRLLLSLFLSTRKKNSVSGRGLIDSRTVVRVECRGQTGGQASKRAIATNVSILFVVSDAIVSYRSYRGDLPRTGRNPRRTSRISPFFLTTRHVLLTLAGASS